MNTRCFFILALGAWFLLPLFVAEAQPARRKAADPRQELKLLMTRPVKELIHEPFTEETWKKNWAQHGGKFEFIEGAMRVTDGPAGSHHPQAVYRPEKFDNVVAQFRFRYDGCQWMGVSFTAKEHLARVIIRSSGFELLKMQGIGSTTKGTRIDQARVKWEEGRWYTMTLEVMGKEILVLVDNEHVLYGEAEGLEVAKSFFLISSGPHAWFDELKIYETQPDPAWPRRKPAVLEQKAKRN